MNHSIELDRRAVEETVRLVRLWDPAAAGLATPCAGWTMADLVAHCTVQQTGFARAVRGERTTVEEWEPVHHADPVQAYEAASAEVVRAFAGLTDPDAPAHLPEIHAEPLPTGLVIGFHLVDNVVHGWDLARTLDAPLQLDDDVLAAALGIARAVPDDERRDRPGAAFAHATAVPAGADPLEETLLLLGRDPNWTQR